MGQKTKNKKKQQQQKKNKNKQTKNKRQNKLTPIDKTIAMKSLGREDDIMIALLDQTK